MKTWIALFRGINVGGRNLIPMVELRSHFESLGFSHVRTYIQSGNVVFDAKAKSADVLIEKIQKLLRRHYAFQPDVLVLTEEELYDAKRLNPFPRAAADPKTLHFYFMSEPVADPDMSQIQDAAVPSERFKLIGRVFYLHAPDGVGYSKLAANVEKFLGVVVTARNYRTVGKLLAMLTEVA